jgi:hypothetical protein
VSWILIALQAVSAVLLLVLAVGWWRLQRTIRDIKRSERLRDSARRALRDG